jgi:hypothetical protein
MKGPQMTTKHTPATPLPWKSCSAFINNAPNRAIVAHKEWGGATLVDCGAQTNENPIPMLNATYIAHAANAYPKLVEALRNCVIGQRVTGGPKGSTELAVTVAAEHLLRSLGESE